MLKFCFLLGKDVARVQIKRVPCTITSMTFFDRLLDSNNNIVCNGTDIDGNRTIRQCMESYKNGIYIADNLKMVCNIYALTSLIELKFWGSKKKKLSTTNFTYAFIFGK